MRFPLILIWLAPLGLCAAAHAAPATYPISTAEVAHAVFTAHPELTGSAVDVPAAVAAHAEKPALEAGPVEHWAGEGAVAHVRLHCVNSGECLPFYAAVHQGAIARIISPTVGGEVGMPTAVHSGTRVVLLIDSGRLHLRLPATALGSGAAGSTVRVAGPARGKVFEALVLDSTTVRGTL